ncbi:hypothetical protein SAMN05216174_106328 [Actinokineospora iranica]|uniref:DUF5753 domain-containing protein n=2 Tax=Actinokineospora iranica TaxID=1271860 RepID=A0A1G6RG90_9PSEU|nr:hypothetical protein SAMN05216174_106328 [Actinokineospora iranica]
MSGPFRIMRYEDQFPVVSTETLNHTLFLGDPTDIAAYQLILSLLAQNSFSDPMLPQPS